MKEKGSFKIKDGYTQAQYDAAGSGYQSANVITRKKLLEMIIYRQTDESIAFEELKSKISRDGRLQIR